MFTLQGSSSIKSYKVRLDIQEEKGSKDSPRQENIL